MFENIANRESWHQERSSEPVNLCLAQIKKVFEVAGFVTSLTVKFATVACPGQGSLYHDMTTFMGDGESAFCAVAFLPQKLFYHDSAFGKNLRYSFSFIGYEQRCETIGHKAYLVRIFFCESPILDGASEKFGDKAFDIYAEAVIRICAEVSANHCFAQLVNRFVVE
jgi:hypothetical protein